MGVSNRDRDGAWGLTKKQWQVSPGAELYPLPLEFPSAAIARLLAAARGLESDPRVIAHAVWNLAGYGLHLTGEGNPAEPSVSRRHLQTWETDAANRRDRGPKDRAP